LEQFTLFLQLLHGIPGFLLIFCVIVAMGGFEFSLVDIEPFDAWLFRIAGIYLVLEGIPNIGIVQQPPSSKDEGRYNDDC